MQNIQEFYQTESKEPTNQLKPQTIEEKMKNLYWNINLQNLLIPSWLPSLGILFYSNLFKAGPWINFVLYLNTVSCISNLILFKTIV